MTAPSRSITVAREGGTESFGVWNPSRDTSVPTVNLAVVMTAQTQATGTNWTTFAAQACDALDLVNNTGTSIEYRRNGAGSAMVLADKSARLIVGITNANQIQVRRVDTSNTQVTVQAEALS